MFIQTADLPRSSKVLNSSSRADHFSFLIRTMVGEVASSNLVVPTISPQQPRFSLGVNYFDSGPPKAHSTTLTAPRVANKPDDCILRFCLFCIHCLCIGTYG